MGTWMRRAAILAAFVALLIPLNLPFSSWILGTPADPLVGNIWPAPAEDLIKTFRGKHALIVGGTRGIGRGIALALAKYGANVRIVGRSANGGDKVMKELEKLASFPEEQKFKSYSYDLSTVKTCLDFTKELQSEITELDYIALSIGVWPDWNDPYTKDGIDKVIATDIVARFIIVREVMPLMRKDGRIMNVLASTVKLPHPDIDVMKRIITNEKKDNGLVQILTTAAASADVYLKQASHRYPLVHFIGTNPGPVATEIFYTTFPNWLNDILRTLMRLAPFVYSEEQSGEIHAQILASENAVKRRATFFSHFLEGREPIKVAYDEDFGKWLWDFVENFVNDHST